jgi:hypothetical protein
MSEIVDQNVATITPVAPEKKRCVYYDAFTEEEKAIYEKIRDADALDEEIDLLRVKIFALAIREPNNITLLLRSLACLDRLCKTNAKVFKRDKLNAEKIKQDTLSMLKGINVPTEFIEKKFH